MAGRAKKNAQREKRKMEKRARKNAIKAEYQAKIAAGRNSKSRADRLRKQSLRNKLVSDVKEASRALFPYVPPSQYGREFWSSKF